MAITFIKERKKQKYLLLIFIIVLVVIIIVFWEGFFRKKEIVAPPKELPPKKVLTLNFNVLEDPILKEFHPFEEIQVLEIEPKGRDNPFLPYGRKTEEISPSE